MLGIFLDTEASGLNACKHKILEIAFRIVDVKTGKTKGEYQSLIYQSPASWSESDPESLRVNGFTWEEVEKGKKIDLVSSEIQDLFSQHEIKRGKAVFLCQNPSFDRAFFSQLINVETQEKLLLPYHWLDLASMHWAKSMEKACSNPTFFPWETGLSKDKIASTYQIPPEKKPHRAMCGVLHLISCYEAVVGFPFS